MRAVVPFSSGTSIGVIVAESVPREGIKPKPVRELPDSQPVDPLRRLSVARNEERRR